VHRWPTLDLFPDLLREPGQRSSGLLHLGITLSREQLPDEDDAGADLEADPGHGGAEPPDAG